MFEVMYLSLLFVVIGLASFAMEVADFLAWRKKRNEKGRVNRNREMSA